MPKQKTEHSLTIRTLQDLWLSENEAVLYALMLEHPKSTVQELVVKSPFPRTLLYYVLKKLEEKSLIKARKDDWKTVYIAENPEKLYDLLHQRQAEYEKQTQAIKELIPTLKESFQLKHTRPSVGIVDGVALYEKLLEDTLLWGRNKELYAYETFALNRPWVDVRESYENKRVMRKIQKHVLFFESPETLSELAKIPYNDYTDFRSIQPNSLIPFTTDIILYNGKILYTTYTEYEPVVVLIEDAALYEMQKNIFLHLWKTAKEQTLYFTKK